jgi:hypothetical protein
MRKAIINNNDVISLHSIGLSSTKIASKLNTSVGRIREILEDNELNENIYIRKKIPKDHLINPIKELYEQGFSKKKIARNLNTYFGVVSDIIKNNNMLNYIDDGCKCCSACNQRLPFSKFGNSKKGKYGKRSICKLCRKKEPSRKEYLRKWTLENKELKSKLDKEYRERNKEKIIASRKTEKYKLIKAKSDKKYYKKAIKVPSIKMAMRMRSMISSYAKYKTGRTFSMLGYSNFDLVNHLESKFSEGMTWDNYGRGGWHIDHIRPLASFDKEDPEWLIKAFSLDNLQPLYESDNCSKGSLYNGVRYRMGMPVVSEID